MTIGASGELTRIVSAFDALDCAISLHARSVGGDAELAIAADQPRVAASVFKMFVGLEFYAQAVSGLLDAAEIVELSPQISTPGPTGASNFRDPARISLRDLAYLMLTVSDNAATDILLKRVGLEQVNARASVCGCDSTLIHGGIASMLATVAADLDLPTYADVVAAQSGDRGEDLKVRTTDSRRLAALRALDPIFATHTTARDMTSALAAVARQEAAPSGACAELRNVMAQQVTRRFEPALKPGGRLWAKSGGLFGVVRNETGVIEDTDGRIYVVAVLTHAVQPFQNTAAINHQMGRAAALAVDALRLAA